MGKKSEVETEVHPDSPTQGSVEEADARQDSPTGGSDEVGDEVRIPFPSSHAVTKKMVVVMKSETKLGSKSSSHAGTKKW